ncbi:hypothetical protein GF312_06525 [Candidatus Poribacteria bacterium]|nr:hypothetical protein [Candidatus Poribacteria bacterium]
MFVKNTLLSVFALTLFVIASAAFGVDLVLFEEDFEGLTLGANVGEDLAGANVWTDVPPAGWTIVDDLPEGMPEWNGWAFANGEWWTQAAGDQNRSQFTSGDGKAVGTIAIADPDEWDDLNSPGDQGTFNSWLSTPVMDITGVAPDSMVLTFDSSWRPEDTQTVELTVSFDGGDEIVLIRMESSGTNTIYKEPLNGVEETLADNTQVNETIEIDIPNPAGASSAVVTWAMIDATNDWWWAVDNISIKTTQSVAAVEAANKLSTIWGEIKTK